jgi:succinoglycan biosynthesis transport protein ExoP
MALTVSPRAPRRTQIISHEQNPDSDFDIAYESHSPSGPTNTERSLKQLLTILWRNKFRVIGATLGCGLIAYTISFTQTPRYYSEGVIAIQNKPIYMPQIGMPLPATLLDPSIPRSEVQILSARSLFETTARQLGLDRDPDLNLRMAGAPFFTRVTNGMKNGFVTFLSMVGITSQPTANDLSESDLVWSGIVENMKRRVDIRTDGKSYVIYVGYNAAGSKESSDIVNSLMKNFQTAQIESYNKSLDSASDWIKQRASELRLEVQDSDQKVANYRSEHSLVETRAGGTVSAQQLNELNTQLSLARADRAESGARYARAQDQIKRSSGPDSATSVEVLNSPLIQRLRQREAETLQHQAQLATRLGPDHPELVAINNEVANLRVQIRLEISKILGSLQNQAVISQTREQTLVKQIGSLQANASQASDDQTILNQMQKEADTKRNVYEAFLATAQNAADPSRVNQANARIVSSASAPAEPASPKRRIFAIAGMFVGFLAAGAISILMADLDRGFDTSGEIEAAFGLPVLGSLPFIRRRSPGRYGLGQELIDGPDSPVSETLRGIRIALKPYAEQGVCQVVLITSTEPSEGKTSFASAMAAVAARDGLHVLIVDSDLRRPRFHRMFQAEPGPALQDVLNGRANWLAAIRTDPHSGAHCLTAHERTDSPVALLSSGHWEAFLSEARKVYDLIILDSPPVSRVADALTLADYADTTLFVIAYHSAQRQLIQVALRRFIAAHKSITGIVMSKVPASQAAQYYSGYNSPGSHPLLLAEGHSRPTDSRGSK